MTLRRPNPTAAAIAVGAIAFVGLAGAAVTLADRGADGEFVYQQQSLAPVATHQVSGLLVTTSDPRPESSHGHALAARCTALGNGALRNPWRCVVSYPPSRRYPRTPGVTYRIVVAPSGTIRGVASGGLTVRGCCVATGGGA